MGQPSQHAFVLRRFVYVSRGQALERESRHEMTRNICQRRQPRKNADKDELGLPSRSQRGRRGQKVLPYHRVSCIEQKRGKRTMVQVQNEAQDLQAGKAANCRSFVRLSGRRFGVPCEAATSAKCACAIRVRRCEQRTSMRTSIQVQNEARNLQAKKNTAKMQFQTTFGSQVGRRFRAAGCGGDVPKMWLCHSCSVL